MTQISAFPHYRTRVLRVLGQQPELPILNQLTTRLMERLADINRPLPTILNASVNPAYVESLLPTGTTALPVSPSSPLQPSGLISNFWLSVQEEPAPWLHKLIKTLPEDAPLLATTLGSQSLSELFHVWQAAGLPARLSPTPLPDVQAAGSLLQRLKVALPVVDRDIITLTFPTIHKLFQTLQSHAALVPFQPQSRGLLTPRQLARLETTWRTLYPRPDGRLPLTLEVLYLHGFTPGGSQPTAAKRGSGTSKGFKGLSFVRINHSEN